MRQLAWKIVVALSEQNIGQALYFKNSFFRIDQLTMLFAAQKVLYWFRVSHFYITMSNHQKNCNLIVLLRSDFASIFIRDQPIFGFYIGQHSWFYRPQVLPKHCYIPHASRQLAQENTAKQVKTVILKQWFSTFSSHGLFSDQYKSSRTQGRLRLREWYKD